MKGDLKEYKYRKPLTPEGIKAIDNDTLNHFDVEMYGNFNTGTLEQYLDNKAKVVGFKVKAWSWPKILVGLLIGLAFAAINQYVGLKIGMIVGGSWYVAYLLGMALRWSPNEINVSAGTSTGASYVCTGFVFTFPAIYLLFYDAAMHKLTIDMPMAPVIASSIIAAILGVFYFIIFRRVWLVEDPLPLPGFQAWIKLLDMAHDISAGAAAKAKRSMIMVAVVSGLAGLFTFLRDFPVEFLKIGAKEYDYSLFDRWFGVKSTDLGEKHVNEQFYGKGGDIMQPLPVNAETGQPLSHPGILEHTWFSFNLSPIMLATGWFMEFKAAFLINLGTLFSWFVVIPLAIYSGYKFPLGGEMISAAQTSWPAWFAYTGVARIMGIGAILGGGFWSLIKMAPAFKSATADLFKLKEQKGVEGRSDYVGGKGWYEWPITHILVMVIISTLAIPAFFIISGYNIVGSIVIGMLVVVTTFFLGAIAVKVMGETSVQPVSGTSFIVLVITFAALKLAGLDNIEAIIMALLGTTVFGCAISMCGDIIADFKNALYVGNRPYWQMKGEIIGIVPGMIVAGTTAILFSIGLAEGKLALQAPQAHAFAGFATILMGGQVDYLLLGAGAAIGITVDIFLHAGTSFGLGMYFPLSVSLPMLAGGIARDVWEKRWLEPKAKKERWDEKKKTMVLLDTYMIATGMIVGEAIIGTIVAVYLVGRFMTGA